MVERPRARGQKAFKAAFAGYSLDAFDLIILTLTLAAIGSTFDVGKGATGALATVTLSASAVGGILGGVLSDRIGRARTLMLTVGVYSLFTFLSGLASSYEMLLVFRVFQGIGFGGEWAVGAILVAELIRPEARGKALGVIQSAWAVGWALAVVAYTIVFSLVSDEQGWRILMMLGILPALLILYVRRNVEDPEVFSETKEKEKRGDREAVEANATETPLKQIFRSDLAKTTVFASILATGIQGGYYAMFTWIPTYLKEERSLSVVGSAGYLFVVIAGAFLGYLSAGFVHDRLGRRKSFTLFAALAGVSLVAYFLVPERLEHDAADHRLPARLLRLGLLLGLRLLPVRALPDAGARDRRGLLLQRRPRVRRAVPGHHRLPRGGHRPRRRRRVRRLRLRARDRRAALPARDPRQGARPGRVTALSDALAGARVYDLEQPRYAGAPVWPAHEPGVLLKLHRRHEAGLGEARTSASALLVMAEHSGTHIDAFCHQAENLELHGGVEVDAQVQTPEGFTQLGHRHDRAAARARGAARLRRRRPRDRRGATSSARPRASRSTRGRRDPRPHRHGRAVGGPGGVPGRRRDRRERVALVRRAASRWRSAPTTSRGTCRASDDPELGTLPGHLLLLVRAGIYIIEALNLEALARDGVREFAFVCLPLKLRGGTGSPVRPIALV